MMNQEIESIRSQNARLEYVFNKDEHTFYNQLLTFLTSFFGNYYGLLAFVSTKDHGLDPGLVLKFLDVGPLHSAELISQTSKVILIFYPYDILSSLQTIDSFPTEIRLYSKPITTIKKEEERLQRNLSGKSSRIQITERFMIQFAFIDYYEKHKPKMEKLYGRKVGQTRLSSQKWPHDTPWGFACFVRNCYVHYNGKIHFSDTSVQSVSWDGITILNDQASKNKPIATRFFSVEAIRLMRDMDEELKRFDDE
jgi:hypothetical protein